MKRLFTAFFAVSVLFFSCSFNFGDDGKDTSETETDVWTYDTARYTDDTTDVEVEKAYRNGVFKSTTERFIDENELVYQIQEYSAAGTLLKVTVYSFEAEPAFDAGYRISSAATWGPSGAGYIPTSFTVYGYSSELEQTSTVVSYEVSGNESTAAAGAVSWYERFGALTLADPAASATEAAYWADTEDSEGPELSKLLLRATLPQSNAWNVSAEYGDGASALETIPSVEPSCPSVGPAGAVALTEGAAHDLIDLAAIAVPSDPDAAVPDLPDPLDPGIEAVSYTFRLSDADGDSTVLFDGDWLPVSVTRANDERLPGDLTITVERDEADRILNKSLFIDGDNLVTLSIDRDAAGFPTTLNLEGDSFVVPFVFTFDYDEGTHTLRRIDYTSPSGAGLVYATFDYVGADVAGDLPNLAMDSLRGLDPFGFMEGLIDPNVEISLFNGDEELWMRMTTESVDNGYRVTVWDPKDDLESTADDVANGYWEILYGDGGAKASVSSWSKTDVEQWRQEYDYGGALVEAVTDILPSGFLSAVDDGLSVGETVMELSSENPEVSDFLTAYVTNFINEIFF